MWTEMLAAPQVLSENFQTSTWVRRRSGDPYLVYQLMANANDPLDRILDRLGQAGVDALDLNLGCHAKLVRSCSAGSALFEDLESLSVVLQRVRGLWPHVLTAKIRLGHERPGWQARFEERLRLLEDSGVDAVTLHPRFFEEKFKRRARHELLPWVTSLTRLPVIANGDLVGPESIQLQPLHFENISAVMLGRMAVVRPWIFAAWDAPGDIDFAAVWLRMFQHVSEDFRPNTALRRLKMFSKYFSTNFKFGHQFKVELGRATTLEDLRRCAETFLSRNPATLDHPTVAGLC